MTDFDILTALSKVNNVAIVVQKEDFLRPDLNQSGDWKSRLRSCYKKLSNNAQRYEMKGLLGKLSVCSDPTIDPIRCVGNHNSTKQPAFPRMHNKFVVFCDNNAESSPKEVWTGSFNLTQNASMSLENALLISDSKIATSYYNEFCQIFALSEPLDWDSEWCAPEFRIGT